MSTRADTFHVEWDEDGLHLHVVPDEGDDLDIRITDPEALLTAVSNEVLPWLAERDAAFRSFKAACDAADAADAYDLSDPKHPTYHERMSSLHDNREGK